MGGAAAVSLFAPPDGILPAFLLAAGFFALTVGLTVLIETPIIVRGKVTDNKAYIRGVNIVTNVLFNMVLLGLGLLGPAVGTYAAEIAGAIWFILGEAVLVPVSEAMAYRRISGAGTKRIFGFTHLANLISCAAGLALGVLVRNIF